MNDISATHLVYQTHADRDDRERVEEESGICCFCRQEGLGLPSTDAINHTYFSDYSLMDQPGTEHVCAACAYCMSQRELKNGHWLVTEDEYVSISTGDLPDVFEQLRAEVFEPPLAMHLTDSPIQSTHAYLWTPVNYGTTPVVLDFDRQTVRFEWESFDELLDAVEELRWHGFTFDEIRSGEPRFTHLNSIGRAEYQRVEAVIEPYRRTPLLETVLTLSQPAEKQDRAYTTDGNMKLSNYV